MAITDDRAPGAPRGETVSEDAPLRATAEWQAARHDRCLGLPGAGATRGNHLQNTRARVHAGSDPLRRAFDLPEPAVTWGFDQYATDWLGRWSAGALGEDKPDDSTITLVREGVRRSLDERCACSVITAGCVEDPGLRDCRRLQFRRLNSGQSEPF